MKTITTIICSLMVFVATAQWTNDTDENTLVVDSEGGDMQAIGTSDGKTYVVFWETVSAPTNYELRMQVLDADGNQTLGSNGMLVSDQVPMSSYTVVWKIFIDEQDNIYIGVTGTGGGDPAYVFKLDSEGNHLWGSDGVNVGSGNVVTVLPLSEGGAVVSWLGAAGGLMQKFDENGDAVWSSDKPIEQGSSATVPANLFELSEGNYVVVFHSLLFGINSNLYAQRYDSEGDPIWSDPTQLADGSTAFNRPYKGVQDGDIVYMGYSLADNSRFDSYLQRINPDGTLPWGINGADFSIDDTNYEMETEIAFDPESQYVWTAVTCSNELQSQKGEYVQKFDKDSGEGLLTENAKAVFPIGSEKVHAGSLQLKNGSPFFLMKEGMDNGATPVTLHAVYLDENGDFIWPEETEAMATFQANKRRIQFTKGANDQNVAVFIEDKGQGKRIYAQNYVECVLSISCPTDVTVSTDVGACTATGITLEDPTTSGCSGETINNDAPIEFLIGETIVTWTVDNGSATVTCTQTITVEDTIAPEITCVEDQSVDVPTATLYTLPDYFATGETTATDNCTNPVTITSQDPVAGTELATGVYQIALTAEDEYGNESTCNFELTVNEVLGVNDQSLSSENILMFPNPANNQITIANPNAFKLTSATIYDMLGRLIDTVDLTDMGSNITIDISGLTKAFYLVVIQSEQSQITKQLVKW